MKGVKTMTKFELSDIMKLLDAGYTKEEIMALENQPNDEPPTEDDPQEEPRTESPAENNIDISSAVNELKEVFNGFKKELTAMNIMNSRIDKPDLTGEDVIAKIINPFNREKEN